MLFELTASSRHVVCGFTRIVDSEQLWCLLADGLAILREADRFDSAMCCDLASSRSP